MLDWTKVYEYGENLEHFIRDVRLDFDAPEMPFSKSAFVTFYLYTTGHGSYSLFDMPLVIGELGMHGMNPTGHGSDRVLAMRATQHSVALLPEFSKNTMFVRTAPYVVLNGTTYNGEYHYNGRADTFFHMGQAFGNGLLKLLRRPASPHSLFRPSHAAQAATIQ